MKLANTDVSYGLITRVLHWCVALLIIFLIALGWWMVGLSYYDRWYHDATQWHKALGMIVLFVGSVKVGWFMTDRKVAFSADLGHWERVAAHVAHVAFLALMVLIPFSGYLISTSAGDGVMIFAWFEVPALLAKNADLRDWAIAIHYWTAYGIGALALLHAIAALKHQFLDCDGTLRRMLW
jgi:cytochrome b561